MRSMPTLSIAVLLLMAGPVPAMAGDTDATGASSSRPAERAGADRLAALERKILGTWWGPPCGGDYTFNADGTFTCESFTPGQNHLAGTWSIRWEQLPPTLVLTCTRTDFRTKDPGRPEYVYLGKPLEVKLKTLSDNELSWGAADAWDWHGERPTRK